VLSQPLAELRELLDQKVYAQHIYVVDYQDLHVTLVVVERRTMLQMELLEQRIHSGKVEPMLKGK